jgi:hypothetical protein
MAGYVNQTYATVSQSATTLLDKNHVREYMAIQNRGNQDMFLRFDDDATNDDTTVGFKIAAGFTWQPKIPPRCKVSAICKIGESTIACVLEW